MNDKSGTPGGEKVLPDKPCAGWPGWIVLAVFAAYAVVRTWRSVAMIFPADTLDMHDLRLIYSTWKQFVRHDSAAQAMQTITYLPYVWWGMTPLFCLSWPATKLIWLVANFALAFFMCCHLGKLLGLGFFKRCAMIVFFFSWLSTGLVIGLGNLAMASLAAVLAAFPFQTRMNTFWLIPAAFKHSLSFPVYLMLLIRRPQKIIVPMAVLSLLIFLSMAWTGTGPRDFLNGLKAGQAINTVWMHENPTVSLVPFFEGLLGQTALAQIVNWSFWFVLFGTALVLVRNPLILLAALLLLSLLPMHHRHYDMIVALPALALFLKHCRFIWPAMMTISLAGITDHWAQKDFYGLSALRLIDQFYYQALILIIFAALLVLDHQLRNQKTVAGKT